MEFFNRFFGGKEKIESSKSEQRKKPIKIDEKVSSDSAVIENSKETPDSKDATKKTVQKKEMNRREFLKFTANVGARVAVGHLAVQHATKYANEHGKEIYQAVVGPEIHQTKENLESEIVKKFESLKKVLLDAKKELKVDSIQQLTPEDLAIFRAMFQNKYLSEVNSFFESFRNFFQKRSEANPGLTSLQILQGSILEAVKGETIIHMLNKVYNDLRDVTFHGVVYKFLAEAGLYGKAEEILDQSNNEWREGRMTYRSADFLPTAEQITDEEIDPFLSFSEERGYEKASDYKAESKWGKLNYQRKFRLLFNKPEIRQRLIQETDFTHADNCSLIKSVIEYKNKFWSGRKTDLDILDILINQRRQLEKESLIDKDTHVIRYYGYDNTKGKNQFDRKPMDQILSVIEHKTDQVFEVEKNDEAYKKFLQAIEESRGKTFINSHAHGGKKEWFTKENGSFSVDQVAGALADRFRSVLLESGLDAAYNTLGQMCIQADACYAYDFLFKNLVPTLKYAIENTVKDLINSKKELQDFVSITEKDSNLKNKEKILEDRTDAIKQIGIISQLTNFDFKKVFLPRVISYGQEGNPVYSYVEKILLKYKEMFKKTKKLQGKDLLAIQSEVYAQGGDMGFSSSKDGQIYQISELETAKEDKAA